MWFILAVFSAIFAALTSIFAKIGIENVNSNVATAIRTSVVLILAWVIVFLTGEQNTLNSINRKKLDIFSYFRNMHRSFIVVLL